MEGTENPECQLHPRDFYPKSDQKRGGCSAAVAAPTSADVQSPAEPGDADRRDEPASPCTSDSSFWRMKKCRIRTENRWEKREAEIQGEGALVREPPTPHPMIRARLNPAAVGACMFGRGFFFLSQKIMSILPRIVGFAAAGQLKTFLWPFGEQPGVALPGDTASLPPSAASLH